MSRKKSDTLYSRIREILETARSSAARSVNTAEVIANWMIGREIVVHEQKGKWRAKYGQELLRDLSHRLQNEFGGGYSVDNLELFRRFYGEYPALISDALPRKSLPPPKSDAVRRKSSKSFAANAKPAELSVVHSVALQTNKSWEPGQLHPNLSWTHYRGLLRIEKLEARGFYEIEAGTTQLVGARIGTSS